MVVDGSDTDVIKLSARNEVEALANPEARHCPETIRSRRHAVVGWMDGVVPLGVEVVGLEVHEFELSVRNAAALRITAVIDATSHDESRLRCRGGDQVHDDVMGDERLATPVLGDDENKRCSILFHLLVPGGR